MCLRNLISLGWFYVFKNIYFQKVQKNDKEFQDGERLPKTIQNMIYHVIMVFIIFNAAAFLFLNLNM